jgi:hypothetical protein
MWTAVHRCHLGLAEPHVCVCVCVCACEVEVRGRGDNLSSTSKQLLRCAVASFECAQQAGAWWRGGQAVDNEMYQNARGSDMVWHSVRCASSLAVLRPLYGVGERRGEDEGELGGAVR